MRRLTPIVLGALLLLTTATATAAAPAAPAPAATSPSTAPAPVSWRAYLAHELAFAKKLQANSNDLSDALDWYDDDTARKVLGSGKRLLAAETKWLATHRPAACFKAVYARNVLFVKSFTSAYGYLYRWMNAYPFGSDADYDRGMAAYHTAITRLGQTTALLNKTKC